MSTCEWAEDRVCGRPAKHEAAIGKLGWLPVCGIHARSAATRGYERRALQEAAQHEDTMSGTVTTTSTEGLHRCGSCLQWVGTAYDGEARPYRTWVGSDGRRLYVCADPAVCERRLQRAKDADRVAAAEARTWFPESEDLKETP